MKKVLSLLMLAMMFSTQAFAMSKQPSDKDLASCFNKTWMDRTLCPPYNPADYTPYEMCSLNIRQECCDKYKPGMDYNQIAQTCV